jgi:hypothetical protein
MTSMVFGISLISAVFALSAAAQTPCPERPMPIVSIASVPADVCIPNGFNDVAVDYFDDFSWRAFVAMAWPAAPGRRGIADSSKTIGGPGARVFETFKSLAEVFHDDGTPPTQAFNDYDSANACAVSPKFGDVILATKSGYDDIAEAGHGDFERPLVAQNGRYVRYQTLYNQIAYDYLVRNKFYLRTNLPSVPSPAPSLPVMNFPFGSIALKAAWIDLTGFSEGQRRRLYSRTAVVRDVRTGKCLHVTVGLVGLHIAVKTPGRPQWTWATYEQVDLVPPARAGGPGKFIFNDGSESPMPAENPLPLVPLEPEPAKPFNVTRAEQAPIHPNTITTNNHYIKLLRGTIWENYQLVMTQWERVPGNQAIPVPATLNGDASNTFPGVGAATAFANITMETFDQMRVQEGCMSCHNEVRLTGDFLWSVIDHAWPQKIAPAASAARHAAK